MFRFALRKARQSKQLLILNNLKISEIIVYLKSINLLDDHIYAGNQKSQHMIECIVVQKNYYNLSLKSIGIFAIIN